MRQIARRQHFSSGRESLALFIGVGSVTAKKLAVCSRCRYSSTGKQHFRLSRNRLIEVIDSSNQATIHGQTYRRDEWHNLSPTIISHINQNLHTKHDHPLHITRSIIAKRFPPPTYIHHNDFSPIVSTEKNFDLLGFPQDHPGRSKTDTYYVNSNTVLRTHGTAHQAEVLQANKADGYLVTADVYRRDAIDRSHYPVFHQMDAARVWDRTKVPNGDLAAAVWADLEKLPKHDMKVEDPNPTIHPERNPLQDEYTEAETEAIAAHLKRSLELMVVDIFTYAKKAAIASNPDFKDEPLRVRWIEAYFPFTSPSWELEIFWQGDWLEVLGCGVIRHHILAKAGQENQRGWAFGAGLERLSMLLFEIPDIRLFWSQDPRFLSQFQGLSTNLDRIKRFQPYSKYPAANRDVSFWLKTSSSSSAAGGGLGKEEVHENDVMEIVRDVCGDVVEDVRCIDDFVNKKNGRRSLCYRIVYRDLGRTLTGEEVNELHEKIKGELVTRLGVELR